MGKRGMIASLPADTKKRVDEFLAERPRGVNEFRDWLADEIGLDIGRSTAHEYQQDFERVAARLRQRREITEAVTKNLGEAAVQGKQGRLLVETLGGLIFDVLSKIENGETLSSQDFYFLSKSIKELAQSARLSQDFETKIAERVAKEAAERAVKAAGEQAEKLGVRLTPEALRIIREQVYGIVPKPGAAT
ncbi:MAG: phage protein Gp27 family protein [Alphaproteobacteria bacterium]